ncbi:MAG: NifB/NifX family molybdenum-iron cluster-binding protein [Mobilitalea sp.]
MKIVISATGKAKESLLDKRFGRCEIFQIYDTESDSYEFAVNSGVSASGGAGIKAAGQIIEANADVIITGNLGPNAYELIEKAGIKAYSCDVLPVFKVIELFKKNKLSEISNAGSAHHGLN